MSGQKEVYSCLLEAGEALSAAEIAKRTGTEAKSAGNNCYVLKTKGLVKLNKDDGKWSIIKQVNPDEFFVRVGGRGGARVAGSSKRTPGQGAFNRFKSALEEMMNAGLEIQNFVMMENEREELSTLREWKRQIEEAAAKFKKK